GPPAPGLIASNAGTPGAAAVGAGPAPAAFAPRAAASAAALGAPASPGFVHRSARAALEDAHARHVSSASRRRLQPRALAAAASGHAQAAASIGSLLDALDRITGQSRF